MCKRKTIRNKKDGLQQSVTAWLNGGNLPLSEAIKILEFGARGGKLDFGHMSAREFRLLLLSGVCDRRAMIPARQSTGAGRTAA